MAVRVGTPNYMKYLNKKKVLQHIRENDGVSRADISKQLNISKPTISNLVDDLIREDWVKEKPDTSKQNMMGGRKPFSLSFNKNAKFLIGVDIGGTYTEVAILNLEGEIKTKTTLSTQSVITDDLVEILTTEINEMVDDLRIPETKIMAAGVGVPGITDSNRGIVYEAPSLNWINFPLKDMLENHLSFPTYVENDVNVAVLGEQWKGVASNKNNVVLITLGTGVGCGIIVNGELYHGSHFAAGEIGYMITDKNAAKKEYFSSFKGYGFLDNHVGGPSIVNKMVQLRLADSGSKEIETIHYTARDVFELAKNGDRLAMKVVDEFIEHIGSAIINIISIFNPECVVLGGGISKSGSMFLPAINEMVEKYLPQKAEICITEMSDVSLIGAASLCLKKHESLLKA